MSKFSIYFWHHLLRWKKSIYQWLGITETDVEITWLDTKKCPDCLLPMTEYLHSGKWRNWKCEKCGFAAPRAQSIRMRP